MPDLSEVVVVNITRSSTNVSRTGFGIPLILGVHTQFAGRVQSYTSLSAVADDFDTTDAEYLKAADLFAQELTPLTIKIGRRVANIQQENNITVGAVEDTTLYTVTIGGVVYDFTSDADATEAEIVTGLVAAIDAGDLKILATDNTTDFDLQADIAGDGFPVTVSANLAVTTTTANIDVASELQEVIDVDNDFYFVHLTSKTKQDILRMAAVNEARTKLFFPITNDVSAKAIPQTHIQTIVWDADFITGNTIDLKVNGEAIAQETFDTTHAVTIAAVATAIQLLSSVATAVASVNTITVTSVATGADTPITRVVVAAGASQAGSIVTTTQDGLDVAQELEDNNYDRTALVYTETTANNTDAAWTGRNAPENPGSITWKFTKLSSIVADNLLAAERTIVLGKNVSLFSEFGGVDIMEEGKVSGDEFIDTMRGTDWIITEIQSDVYAGLVNEPKKVPYTTAGMTVIMNLVRGALQRGVLRGVLADDPAPVVTIPDIADVSTADKTARLLQNVAFTATYSGAIHKTIITGNISV